MPAFDDGFRAAYEVEREVSGAGMSRVFAATERALGRRVAIKLLDGRGLDAGRFRREIMVSARLQHPHIVPVHSAGETAGTPYFVMPWVEGTSLRERITAGGALPIGEATRILRDIAAALHHAHGRGVVHRDLKPENVMLSGGSAIVLDFGVAKALAAGGAALRIDSDGGTGAGYTVGTPAYMAPEQLAADPGLDHRADVYSFGVLAFETVTGRLPFEGTPAEILRSHLAERAPDVRGIRSDVPAGLSSLISACLEKSPDARPGDAGAIIDRLDEAASREAAGAVRPPLLARVSRWRELLLIPGSYLVVTALTLGWLQRLATEERVRSGALEAAIIGALVGFPISVAAGALLRLRSGERARA